MWRSAMIRKLCGAWAGVLVLSIALGWLIVSRMERSLLEQVQESLRSKAILVSEALHDEAAPLSGTVQERLRAMDNQTGTRITLLDENGGVLVDSEARAGPSEQALRPSEAPAAQDTSIIPAARF